MRDEVALRPSSASWPGVTEVVVSPTTLRVHAEGAWQTFELGAIAERRGVMGWLRGRPRSVGERDGCRGPSERSFAFRTSPPLRVCMPVDEPREFAGSTFWRVKEVLAAGGFVTHDLS